MTRIELEKLAARDSDATPEQRVEAIALLNATKTEDDADYLLAKLWRYARTKGWLSDEKCHANFERAREKFKSQAYSKSEEVSK